MTGIPNNDIREILFSVEKPGRYAGGEFGCVKKEGILKVAVSYPDLYEIGMSNHAIKILYHLLNSADGVRCERVFTPAFDLEGELKKRHVPLFSLESGLPLDGFDVIAFSVGYELNATNVLSILASGQVPLRAAERTEGQPIVIGGGPGLTNPAPWLRFFDCVYVGEAEEWIREAFSRLALMKKRNALRSDLLQHFHSYPAIISRTKPAAKRAIAKGFGKEASLWQFPVSSIKTAQDHGTIEIMRGCPNGCRFCNAGFIYRPFRLKDIGVIRQEVMHLIFSFGYRELSLSSLSTGDYPSIHEVLVTLNADCSHLGVSFSLPSLRIDTLALELFREIKTVRKSGLTFAVESPCEDVQKGINKIVSFEKTISLLREAKTLGWKQAKFYFMLGLPGYTEKDETDQIIDCLESISRETRISLHINLSIFIPKPHTPFQWCGQLAEDRAFERIGKIRSRLDRKHFKVSFQLPYQSFLEGMIARGDERVGVLVEKAFQEGARFDAWEEYVNRDLWQKVIGDADWNVEQEVNRARTHDEKLPWDSVDTGVAKSILIREAMRAEKGFLTSPCSADCLNPCGVCDKSMRVESLVPGRQEPDGSFNDRLNKSRTVIAHNEIRRVLFSFSKEGKAVFLSHLNLMTIFERAILRAGYYCRMTEGFNPKPVIEFANPLPLGFSSQFEVALVELYECENPDQFIIELNRQLPEGIAVKKARILESWKPGQKKRSLMSCYWGGDYVFQNIPLTILSAGYYASFFSFYSINIDKKTLIVRHDSSCSSFRELVREKINPNKLFLPMRIMTLAKDRSGRIGSYFQIFS